MYKNHSEKSIIVITGMPNSGSSLTASFLQSAGLHLGRHTVKNQQVSPTTNWANPDFTEFHQEALRSQGIDVNGWTLQEKIEVEENLQATAEKIVSKNAVSINWGWQENRTTLFLQFWAELLPTTKFLLVYRNPWEVTESLYRRYANVFQIQPELAIKIWMHYNERIINFYNRHQNICVLANIQTIINEPVSYIETINDKFATNFSQPETSIYQPEYFHNQSSSNGHRPNLINQYYPDAIEIYQELEARAWQPGESGLDFGWQEMMQATSYKHWVFQDWLKVANLASENTVLSSHLRSTQVQVEELSIELEKVANLLADEKDQLLITQEKLTDSEKELKEFQLKSIKIKDDYEKKLKETEKDLSNTLSQLEKAQKDLATFKSEQANYQQMKTDLAQVKTRAYQNQSELLQYQSQLHQTQEELEQAFLQLQGLTSLEQELASVRLELQEALRQLGKIQQELFVSREQALQYQDRLYQTQEESIVWQQQLLQTQALLQKTQNQLQESELLIKQSRTELQETKQQLTEKSLPVQTVENLLHSQVNNTVLNIPVIATQASEQVFTPVVMTANDYAGWVKNAWLAYQASDFANMQVYLQKSSQYSDLPKSQIILEWLDNFADLAIAQGKDFDSAALTSLPEWQQLVKRAMNVKSLVSH
jgi:hypothetical protein